MGPLLKSRLDMGLQLHAPLARGYHLFMRCTEAVQVLAALFRFCSDRSPFKEQFSGPLESEADSRCGSALRDHPLIFR
jgi:hypothetical protein